MTVDQYSVVKVPRQTEQGNNWATNKFEEWRRDCSRRNHVSRIQRDILESVDFEELNKVLSTVIVETQKESSEKHPHVCFTSSSGLHVYVHFTSLPGQGCSSVLF